MAHLSTGLDSHVRPDRTQGSPTELQPAANQTRCEAWAFDGKSVICHVDPRLELVEIHLGDAADELVVTDSGGVRTEVAGEAGNDVIRASAPTVHVIFGANGDDTIRGGPRPDQLNGNSGNDSFLPTTPADEVRGGFGIDTISWKGTSQSVVVTLDGAKNDGPSKRELACGGRRWKT